LKKFIGAINRAKAYGRIAFSCPYEQQPMISEKITETKNTILTPLVTLPTPGKATVRVIILADPVRFRILSLADVKSSPLFITIEMHTCGIFSDHSIKITLIDHNYLVIFSNTHLV
jgi:hypothetical protein